MEWETMSGPDLVNLVNQLAHILDDSAKRNTTKILNFHLQQMEAPKQTPSLLISAVTAKNQDAARKTVTNLSAPEAVQSSNQPFLCFPNPQ